MNTPIISYLPGMSGDFLAWHIHLDEKFFPIKNIDVTDKNQFLFPNMLEALGEEAKNFPAERKWPIDAANLEILRNLYDNKNICFPTHWLNRLTHCLLPNFLTTAVRLYCRDKDTLKLCFFLWCVKSHAVANDPWDGRVVELEQLIQLGDHRQEELIKLRHSFHNWKFLALKYDILLDGKLDLLTYLREYYNRFYTVWNTRLAPAGYLKLTVEDVIYTGTELEKLENYLDVKINRQDIAAYADKNINLVESELGIKFASKEYQDDAIFFNLLEANLRKRIQERPIYDYDYRKNGGKGHRIITGTTGIPQP